ncbi:MAG: PKD domain-containing protein, partial [Bacteroidales bacterium]|nr:PKD domain-containing protein [Bacteroidales bacterium]
DLALEKVNVQRNYLPGSCELDNADTVALTVRNVGDMTENSIPVSLTINGGSPVFQNFTETLLPGESIDLILDGGIDISPNEQIDITAWVASFDDQNPTNDTLQLPGFRLNDLLVDFEADEDISGWSQESVMGTNTWELIEDADLSYSGDFCYGIRTDQGTNDDYLYSPCLHLEANTCYTISFYYRSRFSTENLDVFLATDPVHTAVMDTLVELPNFNSNEYLFQESVFNVETTGDYYLTWHTDGPQSGRYWIYIDNITIYENDLGPEATIDYAILDREVAFTSETSNTTYILWDFGDGNTSSEPNPSHTYMDEGTYTVTFTASNDCNQIIIEEQITIDCPVEASFTFSMPDDPNVVEFITDSEASGYLWDFDTDDISFLQNPVYTYTVIGDYNVQLTTMNGCGIDSITQTVTILEIGFEELSAEGTVAVFPNPVTDQLQIRNKIHSNLMIQLKDITGKILETGVLHATEELILDVHKLSSGVYLLEISNGHQVINRKFIKK